ncbi:MFS transporter [Mycobacterium sp. CVI_P3]|uniref:MFS transporter n=1 Tax=Mycobacterium pinniadriaticum TaxID=2994102 RepID=A0ABT3SCY9_9MYCO|nr:MFS transporter [Mycobacterium pinniadriaticum]MCX2930959.1 MFS transporter [Mycobacterium pinniadriaticum]MCX2937383.1 MFS transporter [Mycobacterium pinniadriaticum]
MGANPGVATSADLPAVKEHRGLVVGAAAMMVAGFLTTLLSPLLAVSFAREFNFGIQSAGLLVALGQGGVALSAFGILPFLPRLDRKRVGIAGAIVAALCLALTGFATSFGMVLVLQIAMGLGAGLCYACANSALAYARFPERAFSIVTIAWMLVGAAMLTAGPTLHDLWPKVGVYLGMAVAELVCVIFIVRLPDVRTLPEHEGQSADADPDPSARIGSLVPAAILVGALFLMEVGNVMIWTFAESIGEKAGLSVQFTATFLGLSQLIGLIGSGITLALGSRVAKMYLIAPAVVVLGVGNLLVGTATGPTSYMIGFLAINLAFFCLTPLLLALAAELDTSSGRLVVVAGGISLVAGAVAPAVGGWIAGAGGQWSRLGVTALLVAVVTLPLLTVPVRAAKHRAAVAADDQTT